MKFFLFADDTNLYYESDDLHDLENVINHEIKHLSLWLKVNRLALNITKTNFVIFHSSQRSLNHNVTLKLDKKALSQKNYIKYLGVIVDCHLNWKQHIINVSKKISRSIGVMYRIRKYLNPHVLKSIYYSLIYSHIVYAIQVWGSANDSELDKILILQKKAVRMMSFNDQYPPLSGPLNPADPIFSKLGILKVHDVFKLQVSKFIYNCLSFNTPQNFWRWFNLNNTVHNYNTISNSIVNVNLNDNFEVEVEVTETNILHTQCSNLVNYGAKKLKVAGAIVWNNLPECIRNSQSVFTLKKYLKKHLIERYDKTPYQVHGFYYVSKLSLDCMKITFSKMHTFFVPPYLPAQLQVRNVLRDGMTITISRT